MMASHACAGRRVAHATTTRTRGGGDKMTIRMLTRDRDRGRGGGARRQRMVTSHAMDSNNNHTSNTALMETLARRFLSQHGKRRGAWTATGSTATPRAWVLSSDKGGDSAAAATIKALEMRVAPDVLKSDTLRGLEFYNTLRAHERAIIVAKLNRPTIVNAGFGSLPWAVDADIDLEDNAYDLANYCDSCPLRDECFGESADSGMCAFECAVRAKSASPQATYYAAMFRDARGSFEEYILVSNEVGHRAQRAMFSSKLRASLGHNVCT